MFGNKPSQEMKDADKKYKDRVDENRGKWNRGGILVWKDEHTACLQKQTGVQIEFFIAYEDLSREGYVLKAQDEGKQNNSGGGFSGGMNSFYFFQKMD